MWLGFFRHAQICCCCILRQVGASQVHLAWYLLLHLGLGYFLHEPLTANKSEVCWWFFAVYFIKPVLVPTVF